MEGGCQLQKCVDALSSLSSARYRSGPPWSFADKMAALISLTHLAQIICDGHLAFENRMATPQQKLLVILGNKLAGKGERELEA